MKKFSIIIFCIFTVGCFKGKAENCYVKLQSFYENSNGDQYTKFEWMNATNLRVTLGNTKNKDLDRISDIEVIIDEFGFSLPGTLSIPGKIKTGSWQQNNTKCSSLSVLTGEFIITCQIGDHDIIRFTYSSSKGIKNWLSNDERNEQNDQRLKSLKGLAARKSC